AWPVGAMPWLSTQVVAGDFNKDGKADVATLTAGQDGVTHVGLLTSVGRALSYAPDAWMTPANEVRALSCTLCWPLSGMPILAGQSNPHRRPLAVKIDNAPAARPHYGLSQADMVWELPVEGFITRLATYYHSQDPQTIGAVRSVRFSDRYTSPTVRGSSVFSAASLPSAGLVRGATAAGSSVANVNIYLWYQSNGVQPVLEVDAANGAWIMAKNIVIIRTDVWVTNVVDDAGGAPSLDMRMTGSGPASIFRDGFRQDGTWSRANLIDPFVFTNFYGHKIYLAPGQTWVHVLPMDW